MIKKKNIKVKINISIAFWGAVLCIPIFLSCGNREESNPDPFQNPAQLKEKLVNVNKKLSKNEDQLIDDYIRRYNWTMTKTPTGLRYWIYKKQNGKKAQAFDEVTINYKVNLINGMVVYDSKTDGQKKIILGKSTAESGLEEALYLMTIGEKAKVIIPSHLAFGLLGDNNKIPQRATLIYDLEVVNIQFNYH